MEKFSREKISEAVTIAYDLLSKFRGYEVIPGHPVSPFISFLTINILGWDGIEASKLESMLNSTYYVRVKLNDGRIIDPCWQSLLQEPHEGLPTTLIVNQDESITGLAGEEIPPEILADYKKQISGIY